MDWQAQWIWLDQPDRHPYNQTVIARKTIELPSFSTATMAITADSRYRLFINGAWVQDGPCRSWPQHFQYDVLDVAPFLKTGRNVIVIVATHFGIANFHRIPQEAGILAQLEVKIGTNRMVRVATDAGWRMAVSTGHLSQVTQACVEIGPGEWFDARVAMTGVTRPEYDDSTWTLAHEYYPATAGPWQDLHPRDVPFLTRDPLFAHQVRGMLVVRGLAQTISFALGQLAFPANRTANIARQAGALATVLTAEHACEVRVVNDQYGVQWHLDGQPVTGDLLTLSAGEHLLTLTYQMNWIHIPTHLAIGFDNVDGLIWHNPCNASAETPWAWYGPLDPADPASNVTLMTAEPFDDSVVDTLGWLGQFADAAIVSATVGWQPVPAAALLQDYYLSFPHRIVLDDAYALVSEPQALLQANSGVGTTIYPSNDGDVELCLDFGKEMVGYVEFTLNAPAGTVFDAYLIEYRKGDDLQHTAGYRNGFRYITRDGLNHYIAAQRRAGRYLFLTLRQMTMPVTLRSVRLVQATYPVTYRGAFKCNDPILNRVWQMSAYTLQLCMEDTYTDCPLYEQTFWIGAARNESLYNHMLFGAYALTLRCLKLAAQSLEVRPLVACHAPSGWDIIIPVWSFLWGINVWDYYFATGDLAGLAELYPAVMTNLRNAEVYCTDQGLFSISAWSLFDWADIDDMHHTVVHNNLFYLGAVMAAQQCCKVLGADDGPWLEALRVQLREALLPLWDDNGSFPDSVHEDQTISDKISQHTSALALIYEALPDDMEEVAYRNLVDPPEAMARIGSAFALQYYLEALEKLGDADSALASIRQCWQPMLQHGATTCWETFPGWQQNMLTRSHCHAWASTPVYLCMRSLLGIVPTAPGAAAVRISPHLVDLEWAEGTCASPRGDLHVAWHRNGGALVMEVNMPNDVAWCVVPNASWEDITRLVVNGEDLSDVLLNADVPVAN